MYQNPNSNSNQYQGQTQGQRQGRRQPTQQNLFVSDEIARIKAAYPGMDHKEAFSRAASNWAGAPENPKSGGAYQGGGW